MTEKKEKIGGKGIVKRVVLTGGPCGGKSCLQVLLSDVFENLGWKVFRVPETATVLLKSGVKFSDLTEQQAFEFQRDLLRVMINIEETFFNLANSESEMGHNCIVLCDRGTMDASAYISGVCWTEILHQLSLTDVELRDQRYDYVVHMITAASGAESFYGSQNNHVRAEGIDLARKLDKLCQNAWNGHPYLDIIDNSTNFDQKCHRAISAILKRLGLEDKRYGKNIKKFKFLVNSCFNPNGPFDANFKDFNVIHTFLLSPHDGSQHRLRSRTHNGTSHFNLTIKKPSDFPSGASEVRCSLSGREYEILLKQADPGCVSIVKNRRCFLYCDKYFQLDIFQKPFDGLMILEAYFSSDTDDVFHLLPSFIPVDCDITGNEQYSLYNISRNLPTSDGCHDVC
jgi:predicted ATPase